MADKELETNDTQTTATESVESTTTDTEVKAATGTETEESGTEQTTTESDTTKTETQVEGTETDKTASEEQQETATDESDDAPVERVVPAPGDYELPEGAPEALAQFAHQNDMTQDQLNSTLSYFGNYLQATDSFQKDTLRKEGEAFVEQWGKQKDTNLSLVHRALELNDPEGELKAVLEETGYGNHPAVLSFFQRLGTQLKEGGFIRGAVHVPQGQKSAAQTLFGNHPSSQN